MYIYILKKLVFYYDIFAQFIPCPAPELLENIDANANGML